MIEVRFLLRSSGLDLDEPTLKLGDSMSVALNNSDSPCSLKKKYNSIAYHCLQEAIAANIKIFA
jgi:hypothetical protein